MAKPERVEAFILCARGLKDASQSQTGISLNCLKSQSLTKRDVSALLTPHKSTGHNTKLWPILFHTIFPIAILLPTSSSQTSDGLQQVWIIGFSIFEPIGRQSDIWRDAALVGVEAVG